MKLKFNKETITNYNSFIVIFALSREAYYKQVNAYRVETRSYETDVKKLVLF